MWRGWFNWFNYVVTVSWIRGNHQAMILDCKFIILYVLKLLKLIICFPSTGTRNIIIRDNIFGLVELIISWIRRDEIDDVGN